MPAFGGRSGHARRLVHATLYHNLGLNLDASRAFDLRGRPYHPVDEGVEPIRELVG